MNTPSPGIWQLKRKFSFRTIAGAPNWAPQKQSKIKISTAGFNLGFKNHSFPFPEPLKSLLGREGNSSGSTGIIIIWKPVLYLELAAPWVHPGSLVHACRGVYWMCLIAAVGGEGGSCDPNDGNSCRELSCHWHAVSVPINKKVEMIRGSYLNKLGWKLPACVAIRHRKFIQRPSSFFPWLRFGILWNMK